MFRTKNLFAPVLVAAIGAVAVVGSFAVAEPAKDAPPAASAAGKPPEMKLPPGWTEADMQACMVAGMPGKMHEMLAKEAGTWQGKTTMWMGPGTDPMHSESTTTITSVMGGRYTKVDVKGDMPGGMGPFEGFGIYGYDNLTKKFTASWIDSMSTGIAQGTGEMSKDGKSLTITYTYTCPVNKKPTTMREVHTPTGDKSKTLEMYGIDPKSGKEFKMMTVELTKKA